MKRKVLFTAVFLSIILLTVLCARQNVWAGYTFMDGKLEIAGFIKETMFIRTQMFDREKPYHDSKIDYLNTAALFEVLYRLKEGKGPNDLSVRLFSGFKWWWQKAPLLDDQYRRSIPHRARKDWMHPRSFEDDILTEAYAEVEKGPWLIRLGKQIVVWGQLDLERVADVINPLDFRRGFPGIATWEEMKQGLWMIRAQYQSSLPGDLLFEAIINPGDYKNLRLMYEGAQPGVMAGDVRFFDPDQKFGIYHWLREKWDRDAPKGWSHNWELGFRVRGNTFDVDWTLLYWNARDDGPVQHPDRGYPFTLMFINAAGKSLNTLEWPSYKVFYYKRYTTIGGTAQYYAQQLWDTVWRSEWYFEIGRPMNKATRGDTQMVYGWTRRNIVGVALQCQKYLEIPGWTRGDIATGRMTNVSITYGWEKILNFDRDLVSGTRNHVWNQSVYDVVTMFVMQELFHNKIVFVFVGNYFLHAKKWMAVPICSYVMPGANWRFDLGYAMHSGAHRDFIAASDQRDRVVIRLRYEF